MLVYKKKYVWWRQGKLNVQGPWLRVILVLRLLVRGRLWFGTHRRSPLSKLRLVSQVKNEGACRCPKKTRLWPVGCATVANAVLITTLLPFESQDKIMALSKKNCRLSKTLYSSSNTRSWISRLNIKILSKMCENLHICLFHCYCCHRVHVSS